MSLYRDEIMELRKTRAWYANAGSATPTLVNGFPAITVAGATPTALGVSAGSTYAALECLRWPTAAAAGSLASFRIATTKYRWADGFTVAYRFRIANTGDVPGGRFFLGISTVATALTNVDPSTIATPIFGIGHNSGDANLKIFGSDGTAGTPVDLGANFPYAPSAGGFYDLQLGMLGTTAWYRVFRWDGAFAAYVGQASGKTARAVLNGSAITPLTGFICNNATATAVGMELASVSFMHL